MGNSLTLTVDQLDAINASLSKAISIVRVVGSCGPGQRPVPEPPTSGDIFQVMEVVAEELEKIRSITVHLPAE